VNPVVHFEIAGDDRKKLCEFYGTIFGWKIDQAEEMDYGMVDTLSSRGLNGGITTASEKFKKGVTLYVGVSDIQGKLDKAVELGAEMLQPVTEIPGVVTFATFRDPHGNTTGLVADDGNSPPRNDQGGTPITWFEIIGKDVSIQEFYAKLFDWEIKDMPTAPGYGTVGWTEGDFGGGIGSFGNEEPYVTIYPEVDDVDATLKAVVEAGGSVVMEATDMPEAGIRVGAFTDPQGIMIGAYKQIGNS
jgi:uncharacterized protein